ncbi:hypothetical protein E2I00_006288, partial [Balaenoptera physalus]
FVGFSSKPSPICGGLGLTVGDGVGCGIVLNFGGSLLGLMDKEVEIVFVQWTGGLSDSGVFSEEAIDIAALYSYGSRFKVIVTGWSLLIVIIEVT